MTDALFNELARIAGPVSRETFEAIRHFQQIFAKWNARINLMSKADQDDLWSRHVLDSAQMWPLSKLTHHANWVDLGSGGGFPGIIIALLMKGANIGSITLVESNAKKSAFLRQVILELSLPAFVICDRIEAVAAQLRIKADLVSARALAPLSELLAFSVPVMSADTRCLFHKGRDYRREIEECSAVWAFDMLVHQSKIERDSVVLDISNIVRR